MPLFNWGLGPHHLVYGNNVSYGGDLDHMALPQPLERLETKVGHAGSQSCLREQAPIKTLDTKTQVSI